MDCFPDDCSAEVKDLRAEPLALQGVVADLTLENRLLEKHDRGWGRARMRYPGFREARDHPHRRAIPPAGAPDFGADRGAAHDLYRWYDRYVEHCPEGLEDRPSQPSRVWNRIPDAERDRIVALALEVPALSLRELAVRFMDTERYSCQKRPCIGC